MEHTNEIAVKILKDQYSDYPENAWHYDDQYKMIVRGMELSEESLSYTEGEKMPSDENDLRVKYALAVLEFLQKDIVIYKGDDPNYTIKDHFVLTETGFYWNQDEDGDQPLDSSDLHRLFLNCPEGFASSNLSVPTKELKQPIGEEEGCACQSCGNKFQVDLNLPDDIWKKISGDKNLFCGICIIKGLEKLGGADDRRFWSDKPIVYGHPDFKTKWYHIHIYNVPYHPIHKHSDGTNSNYEVMKNITLYKCRCGKTK